MKHYAAQGQRKTVFVNYDNIVSQRVKKREITS